MSVLSRKFLLLLFVKGGGIFLGFFLYLIISNKFGADFLGEFVFTVSLVSFLGLIVSFGTPTLLLKKIALTHESFRLKAGLYLGSSMLFIVLTGVFVSLIFLFIVFWGEISSFEKYGQTTVALTVVFLIIAHSLLLLVVEVFKSISSQVNAILICNFLINLFLIIYFVVSLSVGNKSIENVYYYMLIVYVSILGVSIFYIVSHREIELKVNLLFLKKVSILAKPFLFISLGGVIISYTDILVVGFFGGDEDVGVYAVAMKLALVSAVILSLYNSILAPKITKLYNEDLDQMKLIIQRSTRELFVIASLITVFIVLFAKELLMLFGTEFIEGVTVLIILAIGQFVNVAFGSTGYLLMMTGHETLFRNIVLFVALLNIPASIMFFSFYGIDGVALATAVSVVLWNVVSLFFIKKRLGFWVNPIKAS